MDYQSYYIDQALTSKPSIAFMNTFSDFIFFCIGTLQNGGQASRSALVKD